MADHSDDPAAGTTTAGLTELDPVGDRLALMLDLLADIAGHQAWRLSEDTLQQHLDAVLKVRAGVEELAARLTSSVVERDLPRLAGASSPRAWLMTAHGMSAPDAGRLLAEAAVQDPSRAGRVEVTRKAWATGDLSAERAILISDTIARVGTDVASVATDALQRDLLDLAESLTYVQLQHACRHAYQVIDPDGADSRLEAQLIADEARARQLTQLRTRRLGDGTTRGTFRIPDLHADVLRAALDAYINPRHPKPAAADTAAQTSADTDPTQLTYAQRLGRAFLELLEHLPTEQLPQHGAGNATIIVTIPLQHLIDGLGDAVADTGTPISIQQVRRLACNAQLIPMVLGGKSKILDVGRTQRLFDRYQRLALAVRDRGCIFPGCDRPPSWCEAHHLRKWSQGGATDLANGCLLCPFHHHLIHQDEWLIRMATDGTPEAIPPARLDPNKTPIRHQRFKMRARC